MGRSLPFVIPTRGRSPEWRNLPDGMQSGEGDDKNENMKKEHKILIMMAAGMLFLQACTETEVVVQEGTGSVEFRCSTVNGVQYSPASTKADGQQTRTLPEGTVPESSGLHLKITGPGGYSAEYGTVAEYGSPSMKAGAYTAVFSSGDPEKEGPDAAYFEKVHEFTVIARKTSTENVSVALANSVFSVGFFYDFFFFAIGGIIQIFFFVHFITS